MRKNFRKNLKGNSGIVQFETVGFSELLARVINVIFTFPSTATFFCDFYEVLGVIF